MMRINVITNYKGGLYSSVKVYKKSNDLSMDIVKLKQYASEDDMELRFLKYTDVDISDNYKDQFFIYTSSEDNGLIYKGLMEDILYALKMKGAILIPEWRYMRAHHNKVFMEMLRDIELTGVDTGIHSRYFSCNEEFYSVVNNITFPCVYKTAEGAGSKGVALFMNKSEAIKFLEKENCNHKATMKERVALKMGKIKVSPYSNYRKKFVIQNFIPGLSGDYKVLVFGDKYYALSRQNRDNDFRASGGGRLNYEPDLPFGIFDFAKSVFETLEVPIISLDIAYDGHRFYLIEFQCLNFGTATLEYSTHFHKLEDGKWVRHEEASVLEKEFVSSLKRFIDTKFDSLK